MSTRNRHPAASFNLPVETREQLRAIAEHHGLGSETAAIRFLAQDGFRKVLYGRDLERKRDRHFGRSK